MNYNFTEKEFKDTMKKALEASNKADILQYYLEAHSYEEAIEPMINLYIEIKKASGIVAEIFIDKESPYDT